MQIEAHTYNEPMRLNTQAIGGRGSVRPAESNSLYFRQPYQSLDHVLDVMRDQVKKWRGDQRIRQKAVEITRNIPKDPRTGLPDRRNFQAIANGIYDWMKANIEYVRDPDQIELLQSPLKTLEYRNGDCDDHSILAASLLSSLGVPTKFKVVKANPGNKKAFSHIYVVYLADGTWHAFDTTLHAQAGSELSDSRMFGHKFVSLDDAYGSVKKKPLNMDISNYRTSRIENRKAPVFDIATGHELSGFQDMVNEAIAKSKASSSDKNAGTSSLVDTLDNFESISTSQAKTLAGQIKNWIAQGLTDDQIYSRVKNIRGVLPSRKMSSDWKYQLVQDKIDNLRQQINQNQTGSGNPGIPDYTNTNTNQGGTGASNQNGNGNSNVNTPTVPQPATAGFSLNTSTLIKAAAATAVVGIAVAFIKNINEE